MTLVEGWSLSSSDFAKLLKPKSSGSENFEYSIQFTWNFARNQKMQNQITESEITEFEITESEIAEIEITESEITESKNIES